MNHNVDSGIQFAQSVIDGEKPACLNVVQACQRYFDDIAQVDDEDYPYYFDAEAAEKVLKFMQLFPHTKGEWAYKRMLITLEPWQKFGISQLFGWKRKKDDYRRFREVYWEIPRKNAKSVKAALISIVAFAFDKEYGAEVYSGATTEKQAWEVFRPAKQMLEKTPHFVEPAGIQINAKTLTIPETGNRFEAVIGKPGDGSSPHCAIVDEYHEHKDDSLYTTMQTGMGSRRQPILLAITTAGDDISSPCYDKRRELLEVLNGVIHNPELLGWAWTIDEGDDWTDPKVLDKANPNIGVSVYRDFLEAQQQKAINNTRFQPKFKTRHLNVWVSSRSAFFNLEKWKACKSDISLADFEGQSCYIGFDMSKRIDLTASAQVFTRIIDDQRHYYCVSPQFWIPEDTIYSNEDKPLSERYQKFYNQGLLNKIDGAEVDYHEVLAYAIKANQSTPIIESPIDPHGAAALMHDMADEGLNPISIQQNFTHMSDPMKELEAAILSGRFHHDGNELMTWCIGNVEGKYLAGSDDVVRPVKDSTGKKIDGAVALIMAIYRAMNNDENFDDGINNWIGTF